MNLTTFSIESLIVHDVPRHVAGGDDEEIVMSEAPSALDAGLRNLFTERIKRSLSRKAWEVERDPDSASAVPDDVEAIVSAAPGVRDETLVVASQAMASNLYEAQTGANPPGLLIVCAGRVDDASAVSVLKLEREDAIRVQLAEGERRTFTVEYLRDLMLGKNTRVFKASLFKVPAPGTLDGLVSDTQGNEPTGEVARFFLQRFLGCRLKLAPDVATRDFFNATQDFIETLDDPAKKVRYGTALLAELNRPVDSLTPGAMTAHFDQNDRQPYRNHLEEQGAPTGRFDLDIRLIESKLQQLVINFERSRLRLSGPREDIDEFVRVAPEGGAPVEIYDQVKHVRGGTR